MKSAFVLLSVLLSPPAFAGQIDLEYTHHQRQRAIYLVDSKLLGERDMLGLTMDRYRIIDDKETSKGNAITVGVLGPGGECSVIVNFELSGTIEISDLKCQPGT